MKHFFKRVGKSMPAILLVMMFLVIQAVCDLALPDYTSNIVNVGIQQSGIDRLAPEAIRASEMEKILLFVTDENQKKIISENYEVLENDGRYTEKYPLIASEKLYILKENLSEEALDEIEDVVAIPMILYSTFSDPEKLKDMNMPFPEGTDIFAMLSMMDSTQIDAMLGEAKKTFSELDDSIIKQMALTVLPGEYEAIGMDIGEKQSGYIWSAGIRMLLISLIAAIVSIMVSFISAKVGAKIGRDMRGMVFRKVMSFSSDEYNKFSTASLITRCTNDIQQIQMVSTMFLRMVLFAPIIGVGAFLKVINSGASMAWVIGIGVACVMTLVLVLFIVALPKFQMLQKLVDKLNLVSREILTGVPVIRAFSRERHEEKRFNVANKDLMDVNMFVGRVMSIMMPTMGFIMNGISVLIIWVGADKVNNGSMQVGDLMAFIQYAIQIIIAFLMISMMSIILPRAIISIKRIGEVLDTQATITDPEKEEKANKKQKGIVEFKNVSFKYSNAEEYALKNISFTAKPGQTTAIIGSTGSGKSTLINLIPRFYDATEGEVCVNGVNIKNVTQHSLRENLGYVSQKAVLFSGTIASNICYGNDDEEKDVMERAARVAQAAEFINEKPNGFESEISQGGGNVSGGQKQRLSIARAVAKKPDIYIFDDSFSALDYKTDIALRKALKKETGDSTIIIVAQRISTVMNADQIIVLDGGEIAGIGTHRELLSSCEVYSQIAGSQLSKEELA